MRSFQRSLRLDRGGPLSFLFFPFVALGFSRRCGAFKKENMRLHSIACSCWGIGFQVDVSSDHHHLLLLDMRPRDLWLGVSQSQLFMLHLWLEDSSAGASEAQHSCW